MNRDWPTVRLGELLSEPIRNGYSPVCGDIPTGRWVLGLGALGENGIIVSGIKPAPPDDPSVARTELRVGDFLVSRSNTRGKVGLVALWRDQVAACSYPDLMMRFRVDASRVDLDYLEAYLRSPMARHHLQRAAAGTSGSMVKINRRAVETLEVPLPSLAEQHRIANILSTWDMAIEKTERLIKAKRTGIVGLARATAGDGGGLQVRLGEICTISKGVGLSKDALDPAGTHACILYGELHTVYGEVVTEIRSRTNLLEGTRSERGDVLIPSSSETAEDLANATALLQDGVLLGGDINILRPKNPCEYDAEYLAYTLTHVNRKDIVRLAQGHSVVHLYGRDISRVEVSLPDIERQAEVARALRVGQQEVELLRQLVSEYKRQRDALMQTLFSGGGGRAS
ncbi:MAG: restriction endonuclease subunit S [Actinomycetota bacterium]|nr:restriction endonuclease subunit S [Actinomycetota bacterium]